MTTTPTHEDLSLLSLLKARFEKHLKKSVEKLGSENKLRQACEYSLLNGGKRVRPLIVLMTAEALGNGLDVLEACLSVEYFHTASLVADDLPCMDNDDFRRDKPSVHNVYGETVSLLASYALICAGYEKIFTSVRLMEKEEEVFSKRASEVCVLALENATHCSGISGATGGQFLDLFPKGKSLLDIQEMIYKKTITLFEVSFVFGWLFGGGELSKLDQVKEVAYHFGMAFQIADDIGDVYQDALDSTNIAICLGSEKAQGLFQEEVKQFEIKLKALNLSSPAFSQVTDYLSWRVANSD